MKQFWRKPQGINGLLYGQPAVILDAPRIRPAKVPSREDELRAISVKAHNDAIQFERDRRQAAKASRRRIEAAVRGGTR